jgi:hypothetical protein
MRFRRELESAPAVIGQPKPETLEEKLIRLRLARSTPQGMIFPGDSRGVYGVLSWWERKGFWKARIYDAGQPVSWAGHRLVRGIQKRCSFMSDPAELVILPQGDDRESYSEPLEEEILGFFENNYSVRVRPGSATVIWLVDRPYMGGLTWMNDTGHRHGRWVFGMHDGLGDYSRGTIRHEGQRLRFADVMPPATLEKYLRQADINHPRLSDDGLVTSLECEYGQPATPALMQALHRMSLWLVSNPAYRDTHTENIAWRHWDITRGEYTCL